MSDGDIFRAVTKTPASLLKLEEGGSLIVGSMADLVVLERKKEISLTDAQGHSRTGIRFVPRCIVRAGQIVSK